ncbi:hypothetical protein TNIN_149751 [Trichonephila inaurata madagascariensis]|uniref:Uncharacterized protein n=1 Tax=Trichonephila inaurata madagascariensis TaxID=2747483 RepID=A0A8X6XV59_9ARAC|nr:hypothetical protein TNIN_149751 [Trichonephila inaurata madagascariensis]
MLKGSISFLGDSKTICSSFRFRWIVAGNVPSEEMFSSIAVNSIQVVTEELDDLLSGAATEKEAVEPAVWQLKDMMRKGGFTFGSGSSNSKTVIKENGTNQSPEDLNKQWAASERNFILSKNENTESALLPSYIQLEIHMSFVIPERAYCAALTLKCVASEFTSVSLLLLKQELPRLKTHLTRLELCAALLSHQCITSSVKEFPHSFTKPLPDGFDNCFSFWLKQNHIAGNHL